jgi:hypothetical protein
LAIGFSSANLSFREKAADAFAGTAASQAAQISIYSFSLTPRIARPSAVKSFDSRIEPVIIERNQTTVHESI